MIFDKRQTNIAKGIAILLMLWHHLFYDNPDNYDRYTSFLWIGDKPLVAGLANFAKVCVAIFCILSGYGMFKSFEKFIQKNNVGGKLSIKKQFVFVKNHLLKTMAGYWFIYIVFGIIMGLFCGRPFYEIYEHNLIYGIIDFLGVANLCGNRTLNATWWFMYIIILFYLLFPLVYRIFKKSPECTLVVTMFLSFMPSLPRIGQFQLYLFSFVLGMYFSQFNVFCIIDSRCNTFVKKFILSSFSILTFAYLRSYIFHNNNLMDSFFGMSIIIFSFLVVSKVPILNTLLAELGKYSALIFMFHTFIYLYYFNEFIYWFKYPICIFIIFTTICYGVAKLFELLMNFTGYNKLLTKLIG